jgi:NADH:ubiquinone oxidoreductase subunit F (NADH-binding)
VDGFRGGVAAAWRLKAAVHGGKIGKCLSFFSFFLKKKKSFDSQKSVGVFSKPTPVFS